MANLDKEDLLKVIQDYERNAIGGDSGELASDRAEALKRYFGEPYGDEIEGRSNVVTKELAETVDWIMPSLIRVFLSTDEFLKFDPVGPEDEPASQQESDYVNHVIMKENNGFVVLYDWFKDSLISKNGYVKAWWDTAETASYESYTWLSIDQLTLLFQELESSGDKIEVVGKSSQLIQSEQGPAEVFDVKIRRTKKYGKVNIVPVPPEEIRVSSNCRGRLQDSVFCQHVTKKQRSELIEMGMARDFVYDLPKWNEIEHQSLSRDQVSDERELDSETSDKSTDEIEYKETYVKVDYDDDGVAELRRVVVVGNKIPDGDKWNDEADTVPIYYLTPNRMPHRHVGMGMNDEIADISKIKTVLFRQMLDNTYMLTNVEWLVNERVNLSDFQLSRPGGLKRIEGREPIGDAASAILKPSIVQHVLPVLDYMDSVKESRTGTGRSVMGLDPDTLKKTTEGAARMALQQANAKIEMIARLFAETGVKDLALAVHELLIKHQDKKKVVKLRNNWVTVNPQEWKTRTDMTVSVGIGTGSIEEIRSNLTLMASLQERAAQAGVVTPTNVYNLAEKFSDMLGFKQKGMFFTDPKSPEAQSMSQDKPDPFVMAQQIKSQTDAEIAKLKEVMKQEKDKMNFQFEQFKFAHEHALEIAKVEAKSNVDIGKPGMGTETRQPITLSIAELQGQAQGMSDGLTKLGELVTQNTQMIQALAEHMSKPRQITVMRDKTGRVSGGTATIQ